MCRVQIALLILLTCPEGWAQKPDGRVIFNTVCAACHRFGSLTPSPLPDALHHLSRKAILVALESGPMKEQGGRLSAEERRAVAEYLGMPNTSAAPPKVDLCTASSALPDSLEGWNGWGAGPNNSRFQTSRVAGLTRDQVAVLKVKWAFGFPNAISAFGQPTVAGGRVWVGSEDGTVYALDARSGCVYWTYRAGATVRTAVTLSLDGSAVYFGDLQGNVYAVDSSSGSPLWKTQVDSHPLARITGAPQLGAGRLYVPVSSLEELAAADPRYECCTFRGSVVALDAGSGKQLWKTFTVPDPPAARGHNAQGTQMWGPSGGGVWSSPTLDPSRKTLYVGTGDGYSDPPSPNTDAVLAFDMDSGRILWSQQLTPNDRWNASCAMPGAVNCPQEAGPDFDIGASPILCSLGGARRLLVVGQKSGMAHALDPDHEGKIRWQTRLGRGGVLGGIEWGGAADDRAVYFPISDWDAKDPSAGGGLSALEIASGKRLWYAPPAKPPCAVLYGCLSSQTAPATLIPGVAFSGSNDGHLRAYDTHDGSLVWDFDTAKSFTTVNGVTANGGSLTASGPTVAGGMLYLNSGYGWYAGMPGNVLLAFSIDGK